MHRDASGRARLAGLAAGAPGMLYTIDRRGRRVIEISSDGTFREVPLPAEADQTLRSPDAIAADDIGTLAILDRRAGAVLVMTAEGRALQTITSIPASAGEFENASAVALGPRGEIYIYDEKRKTVIRFW
jgi:hypothetical protein